MWKVNGRGEERKGGEGEEETVKGGRNGDRWVIRQVSIGMQGSGKVEMEIEGREEEKMWQRVYRERKDRGRSEEKKGREEMERGIRRGRKGELVE